MFGKVDAKLLQGITPPSRDLGGLGGMGVPPPQLGGGVPGLIVSGETKPW